MEGKKRYIAIILFLLICLMVFTFATTSDEELEQGNGSNIQEVTDKDTSDKEKEETKSEEKEESKEDSKKENNNSNSSSSENTSEDQTSNTDEEENLDGTGEVDNSAYDKALEAVEELEKLLTAAQVEIARDLVEEVTNSDQFKELMERIEDAEDAIDAEELVAKLEAMVKEAAEKADITEAKDFRDEEVTDAVNEIDGENLEAVKEDLLDRIEELSKILDDETNPKIEGIEDGTITNKDVELVITDANEVTVKVTKDGNEIDFAEKFTEEGTYEVTVVDAAFNEVTVTFTIDKTNNRITQTSLSTKVVEGKTYYIINGEKIDFSIGFSELLGKDAKITIGGKEVKLTYDKYYTATKTHLYRGTLTIAEDESEMAEGELEIVISNITDKAGNEGFYYQSNGKKVIKEYKNTLTTNGRKVVYDRTANRVTQTSLSTKNAEGKTYYAINGSKIDFSIGFRELLGSDAIVTIGGKVVELKYDKFYSATNTHLYKGTLTIAEDESEMLEGELEIVISNITDKAGNKGFYYQTNGKKVVQEYKNTLTTNGRKVVYDRTANRVTQTSLSTKVVEGKTYYVINGGTIDFSIGFSELLGSDAVVTIGGKNVELKYDKYYTATKTHLYRGTLTIAEDESEMLEGELEIVISNITDKAGNEGFYYQSNGKKVIKEYKNTLTTNGRKVVYDRTANRVTQTSLSTKVVEGKTYYVINGGTIDFSIGFSELLGSDAVVTIGGKNVELKYDKYYTATKTHLYRGTLTIAEDESEMAEGELEIVISNITDKAGNEDFYYQSNGKKVIKEYKNTLTTNGRKVVYDRTPNFVTKTSLGSSVVEGKTYYVTNGDTIEFSIGFKEELKEDIKVTIGGKEVKVKFDKYIKNDKYYNYKGSLTISEDETELSDGYLEIKISNITDKAGNKGFYYTKLANGVVQEKTFKETTNGRKVFYDTTAPEVTASYNEKTVEEDSVEEFTEFPTFEVKDNSNATVTKELVEGSVDVHKVGTYKLVYKFTDLVGNVTEKTITIKVVDTKAPTISGITNDAYYNTKDTHAIPVANDKNGATLYVKTTILDTEIGTILPKGTELTLVGTYQVYAVDKYGNKSEEITVHIDPYAPKILVLDRFEFVSGAYLPIKPVILEHNLDTITVTLDGNEIDFQEGDQLTEDGEYVMVVTDKAGNKTEVKFTMDSIAPTMTISPLSLGVVTELDLNDIASLNNLTGNIILTEDAEFQLMKASKNVNVLDYNIPIYEYVEMPENGIIDEEGEYILVAYDKAYNVTAAKFVVDKTAPQIKGVENGKHYKEDVTITIIETNRRELLGLDGTVTFKKKNSSGKYITTTFPEDGIISEEGEYSIKAKDLAGNESETITFVVDKTAPSIEVPVKEEVLMGDEKISVVANATDNILSPQKLTPNVTKIVNGVETDLGKQSTIDVSEQGVSYKLEYTITDEAGHTTNKTIITTVVNITYEVRFNEPAYEGTYNGTIHTAPQDAKLYMIKDGVESLVEDAVINYSSETEMKNAGVYTIKAEVNGYYTTTTYTINKAEITVDFSNLPSKAVLNDTLAEYSYLITANHFEGNTEIFDYKMYRTSIGLTSPIPEEAEKVDKVTEGSSWKKVIRTYTIYVSLKEEYEDNYIIKNSINLDLTDYGIDFKVTGVSKTLES